MVASGDTKELFVTIALIAGFSVAGFFVQQDKPLSGGSISFDIEETFGAVPLVANPVVHISVPAHNIFAPN